MLQENSLHPLLVRGNIVILIQVLNNFSDCECQGVHYFYMVVPTKLSKRYMSNISLVKAFQGSNVHVEDHGETKKIKGVKRSLISS